MSLKYQIAQSPGHYQMAHRLLRAENFDKQVLGFPTILAFDGRELIGVVGTRIHEGMIVAGPMAVRTDRRRLFTIMRLCEMYEAAMLSLGITAFIIAVEKGSIIAKGINRYFPDARPYADDEAYEYYNWKVRGHGQQGLSTWSESGGKGSPEEPSRAVGAAAPDY